MTRVVRTIVIEGEDEWVYRTLGSALVGPDRPVYECPRGTITETSRVDGGSSGTANIERGEYERMRRIAEDEHGKYIAALLEVDRLRTVMRSILDDADQAYYERRQGDWFILRLKQALDNGSDEPPPCNCGHAKADHIGRMDDCTVNGCPCPLYALRNGSDGAPR